MPATRFDRLSDSYQTTCRTCGTRVQHAQYYHGGEHDPAANGGLVSDTFRWIRRTNRFHIECRSCEREYRRARRNAGPRVPRTSRTAALGAARMFGVELECMVPTSVTREQIMQAFNAAGLPAMDRRSSSSYWSVKGDGSLNPGRGQQGLEIVSPPLQGDEGEAAVRTACRILRGLGATVNRSCGTHVHHDINDVDINAVKATATSWFNNQNLIDGLVSESRRNSNNGYCQRLTSRDMETVAALSSTDDLRRVYIDRYRTLNLTSYGRHGTIEIRQHQGTLDAEKIISWLRFGQAIIDTAKAGITVPAVASLRTLFTHLGDRMNETARTFLIGRAVEFGYATV